MLRVCMWSADPVGPVMAGPGIRYHRLATELARGCDVTLVAPGGGVPGAPYAFRDVGAGAAAALAADVVVAQRLPLGLLGRLRRAGVRLVFDLYVPALVESAAQLASERNADRAGLVRYEEVVAATRVELELGDAFVCASERQRDHWLGALAALGRVTPETYAADPGLGSLVAIVPFGLDPVTEVPQGGAGPALPGLEPEDRVLLWGGGIWNWLDPLTVIRAVGRLSEQRHDVKLVFLGLTHPSATVAAMRMADRAVALAAELGLEGRHVLFNRDWVAYEDRTRWFARADLGVSAHPDSFEARLAFRTRLLDHVAAGTPLVVTRGDVLADLVESRGLGRAVEPGDVGGWTTALAELLDDRRAYGAARRAVEAAREDLTWQRAAGPLADLVERTAASPPRPATSVGAAVGRTALTLARASIGRRGLRATLTGLVRPPTTKAGE